MHIKLTKLKGLPVSCLMQKKLIRSALGSWESLGISLSFSPEVGGQFVSFSFRSPNLLFAPFFLEEGGCFALFVCKSLFQQADKECSHTTWSIVILTKSGQQKSWEKSEHSQTGGISLTVRMHGTDFKERLDVKVLLKFFYGLLANMIFSSGMSADWLQECPHFPQSR